MAGPLVPMAVATSIELAEAGGAIEAMSSGINALLSPINAVRGAAVGAFGALGVTLANESHFEVEPNNVKRAFQITQDLRKKLQQQLRSHGGDKTPREANRKRPASTSMQEPPNTRRAGGRTYRGSYPSYGMGGLWYANRIRKKTSKHLKDYQRTYGVTTAMLRRHDRKQQNSSTIARTSVKFDPQKLFGRQKVYKMSGYKFTNKI